MRTTRWLFLSMVCSLVVAHFACSGDDGNNMNGGTQCSDGQDNDGDGTKDFPSDPSCTSADDLTEDGMVSPQCSDEIDNDGDGKRDYPNDPGCFAALQDSEEDECPDGLGCPQCSNLKDDDENGVTDFPADTGGCTAASDTDEYTRNLIACGAGVNIKPLPFTGKDTGMLMAGAASQLTSPTCGGSGTEVVYEIRAQVPKVIVATTNVDATTADTVLSLRGENCMDVASEVMCNDNVETTDKQSTLTVSVQPGTYYLVVDSKDSLGGPFSLEVKYFIGEGVTCIAPDECGPGLLCRVPKGGTGKVCAKHICEDGLDEDGDGKNDYPQDPGCESLTDDDETDGCPGVGIDCPECGDDFDNDGDGGKDFGTAMPDATCTSASNASEACVSTDGVTALTMGSTASTTVGAVDDMKVAPGTTACSTTLTTAMAPDKMFRLDLPAMQTLSIVNVNTFTASVALFNSTCAGTPLACESGPDDLILNNLAAGTYYYLVDGYSTASGTFTVNVSGSIANGAPCDAHPLATAGAITCGLGYACQGTTSAKTCQPAACSDGLDSEPAGSKDSKVDFPADPGCDSPGDNDEADPAVTPLCSNNIDDDTDTTKDYPGDFGCASASSNEERFCIGETDLPTATTLITTKTTTGDSTNKIDNSATFKNSCSQSSSLAPDIAYALHLPVPVATLQIDTNGSQWDTTLAIRTLDCAMELPDGCEDQGGTPTNASLLTMHALAPGGYAIIIDGWVTTAKGLYTLNVQGTVAQGTVCSSPLFTGGANAVLLCPAGTTCKGTPVPKCLP